MWAYKSCTACKKYRHHYTTFLINYSLHIVPVEITLFETSAAHATKYILKIDALRRIRQFIDRGTANHAKYFVLPPTFYIDGMYTTRYNFST